MVEELIRPIDADSAHAIEEAAKATSKAIDAITESGKYAGAVFGDLPHDLFGIMGDWVKHVRARRWAELQSKTTKILRDRSVEKHADVSPSVAIPLTPYGRCRTVTPCARAPAWMPSQDTSVNLTWKG
jgi:hypothetical protein